MAKKKRKHLIKLNNKIKSMFQNKPFDSAILDFSDETLYGLMFVLGLDGNSLEQKDIIKQIRRVWSEGDYQTRKVIVDFLHDQAKESKAKLKGKVDLILSFLEDKDTTPQEDEALLVEFMDKKANKITKEKVLNRLFYMRMQKILDNFTKELNIEFVGADIIRFNQGFYLFYSDTPYPAILEIEAKVEVGLNNLIRLEHKEAVEILLQLKNQVVKDKTEELMDFEQNMSNVSYLKEFLPGILSQFSKIPISNLYHAPIEFRIIKQIFKAQHNKLKLSKNYNTITISKSYEIELFGESLEYEVSLNYEKDIIYGSIWTNNIKQIRADIKDNNESVKGNFYQYIDILKEEMVQNAQYINYSLEEVEKFIIRLIKPVIIGNKSLYLKQKIANRVLYYFSEEIKEIKAKQSRQELLAKTIRDFKKLFPVARSLNREIIFNVGPTNSGKTYHAMQELKQASSGAYLAPLRLLALEGYENLKEEGISISLITGEEEIIDEDSTHISSTIEMLNSDIELDVCVIDEIQMIGDRDRGWAWANALIGAPAKKVILTGSNDALSVVQEICEYLGEPLKVVQFERINPLSLLKKATPIQKLEPNTAIVTFSRKDVLALKSQISQNYKVSVVYGNLSPEVRREEAKRFREGKSEILIATDAIAMGLNLPIKTLLFARDNKFDGFQRRELTTSEILQISGRAGRYGLHENGYIGALDSATLQTIKNKFKGTLKPLQLPIDVMASMEHVLLIGEILETNNLYNILEFFALNMEFEGPFVAANIDSMMELSKIVDEYDIDLRVKYQFACAPVSLVSPYLEKVYRRYIRQIELNEVVPFSTLGKLPKKAVTYQALLNAEDRVKEVSLYLWLSFKFGDKFLDIELAKQTRDRLNSYIEKTLRESNFEKYCRICGVNLSLNYRFSICDNCHNKMKMRRRKR